MKVLSVMITCSIIGILGSLVLEWAAWVDISHDYIGSQIRASGVLDACSSHIPEWSACKLEWLFLNASFFIRMLSIFVLTAAAIVGYSSVMKLKAGTK